MLLVIGLWYLLDRRPRKRAIATSVEGIRADESSGPSITTAESEYHGRDNKNELPGSVWVYQGSLRNDFGQSEIRGDLGGIEVSGDSGAFELGGSDASVRRY